MKRNIYLYIILFVTGIISNGSVYAQKPGVKPVAKPTAVPKATPVKPIKGKMYVTFSATKKDILLRWAPADVLLWGECNKYGYALEKFTIVQEGKVLQKFIPHPKQLFKPKPLKDWEAIASTNDYAAVLAQALYGDDFDVEMSSGNAASGTGSIINQTENKKQRFATALYAADLSFDAAVFAGLAYRDTKVINGEKYFYRIYPLIPAGSLVKGDTAMLYAGLDDYKALPRPSDIIAAFQDKSAMLQWDYDKYKESYTSYLVERSADGGKTFVPASDKPITSLVNSADGEERSMYFLDTLISNDTVYMYRIAGVSLFGEKGPYSKSISGKGKRILSFLPEITGINHPANTEDYHLIWQMADDSAAQFVKHFQLNRADAIDGPYEVVTKTIDPSLRTIKLEQLSASNYYTLTAQPIDGLPSTSVPFLVQPDDSTAPATPVHVKAIIDTAGVVTISWDANIEPDLAGYRIYKTNMNGHELVPLFDSIWAGTSITDTVNLKNLNRKVFYAVKAADWRSNESPFSPLIEVKKPDQIPPSQPVMANFEILEKGIKIKWIGSPEEDVQVHRLYKRTTDNSNWQLLKSFDGNTISELVDEQCKEGQPYSYTVIAMDSAGLESLPAIPLTATMPEKRIKTAFKKLEAEVDREGRKIVLSWQQMQGISGVKQFELYRGEEKKQMNLYQILEKGLSSYTDTDLQVNSKYKYGIRVVFENGMYSDFIIKNVTY
jgi:uncharacterized protein